MASSHSSRTRAKPIDRLKKLSLIQDSQSLTFEEENMNELAQAKQKRLIDLPVPAVFDVPDYASFTRPGFVQPVAYIRRSIASEQSPARQALALTAQGSDAAEREEAVISGLDYDADAEDIAWLTQHPRHGAQVPESQRMSWVTVEWLVEKFEHHYGVGGPQAGLSSTSSATEMANIYGKELVNVASAEASAEPERIQRTQPFAQHYAVLLSEGESPAGSAQGSSAVTLSSSFDYQQFAQYQSKLQQQLASLRPPLLPPHIISGGLLNQHQEDAAVRRLVEDTFKHWLDRRNKAKKSLLRGYWPVTSPTDANPHHTFRAQSEKEGYKTRRHTRKNDGEAVYKLKALVEDVAAARGILDLIRARELLKRDLVQASRDYFETALAVEFGLPFPMPLSNQETLGIVGGGPPVQNQPPVVPPSVASASLDGAGAGATAGAAAGAGTNLAYAKPLTLMTNLSKHLEQGGDSAKNYLQHLRRRRSMMNTGAGAPPAATGLQLLMTPQMFPQGGMGSKMLMDQRAMMQRNAQVAQQQMLAQQQQRRMLQQQQQLQQLAGQQQQRGLPFQAGAARKPLLPGQQHGDGMKLKQQQQMSQQTRDRSGSLQGQGGVHKSLAGPMQGAGGRQGQPLQPMMQQGMLVGPSLISQTSSLLGITGSAVAPQTSAYNTVAATHFVPTGVGAPIITTNDKQGAPPTSTGGVAHPWANIATSLMNGPNASSYSGSIALGATSFLAPLAPNVAIASGYTTSSTGNIVPAYSAPSSSLQQQPPPQSLNIGATTGSTVTNGLFYDMGVSKDLIQSGGFARKPSDLASEKSLLFHTGYKGVTIGPWAQPRTVAPHQTQDAFFEHEDILGLVPALGLLLGCSLTAVQKEAAFVGVGYPVLPSRSTAFPMDENYPFPYGDMALYRADVSVQRRMLLTKHLSGAFTSALGWEEASGSGLVAGIGSGITADGRGWHSLAGKVEVTHRRPLHDSYSDSKELQEGAGTADSTGDGGCKEGDGLMEYLDSLLLSEAEEEGEETGGALRAGSVSESENEDDLDWETLSGLADICSVAAADVSYSDSWLCSFSQSLDKPQAEGDFVPESRRSIVMAPRVGRAGRLLFDRVHVSSLEDPQADGAAGNSSTISAFRAGADHALKIRRKHLRRQRCRSWISLLAGLEPLLPPLLLEALKLSTTAVQDFSRLLLTAETFAGTLSAFQLLQGYGYGGDPTDPHASHLHSFKKEMEGLLSDTGSVSRANHAGGDSGQIEDSLTSLAVDAIGNRKISLGGVTTALLAPSRFNRVGDEMTAAVMSAADTHNRTVFGDNKPFSAVTGSAECIDIVADDRWDAFIDRHGPPPRSGEKRKKPAKDPLSDFAPFARANADDPLFDELRNAINQEQATKRRKLVVEPLKRIADSVSEVIEAGTSAGAHLQEGAAECSINSALTQARRDPSGIFVKGAHTAHNRGNGRSDLVSVPVSTETSAGIHRVLADSITFNHDKFRELWQKGEDSDDDDMVLGTVKIATSKRSLPNSQNVAALAFENSTLQAFELGLKKDEGW